MNLYSLFVERAMALAKPDGMIGLLVPSGIASDKTAARFFRGVATEGRLKAFYDFENAARERTESLFPDVDSVVQILRLRRESVAAGRGRAIRRVPARYGGAGGRRPALRPDGRGFRSCQPEYRHCADLPLPARRRTHHRDYTDACPCWWTAPPAKPVKAWPVKYSTMFHMTNDSGLFRTRAELEEKEGAWHVGNNRFDSPSGEWVPLVRRQDGASVRSPGCRCCRQSEEPAPTVTAEPASSRTAPGPELAAKSLNSGS